MCDNAIIFKYLECPAYLSKPAGKKRKSPLKREPLLAKRRKKMATVASLVEMNLVNPLKKAKMASMNLRHRSKTPQSLCVIRPPILPNGATFSLALMNLNSHRDGLTAAWLDRDGNRPGKIKGFSTTTFLSIINRFLGSRY